MILNYLIPVIYKDCKELRISFFEIRLKPMQIIFSSIFCYFFFKKAIYLHQKLSLILIFSCIVLINLTEFFFNTIKGENYKEILTILKIFGIMLIGFIIISLADCLEKYLMDIDFCSRFKLLFVEGISGIFLSSIYYIFFEKKNFNSIKQGNIYIIIIILIIFYILLSGLLNTYRLTIITKLSPMNTITSDSFVDPFIIIYSIVKNYVIEKKYSFDFDITGICYLIINIFVTFIIIMLCLIYNEIFVLRCCGLDKNTYAEISYRSCSDDLDDDKYQKTINTSSVDNNENENDNE